MPSTPEAIAFLQSIGAVPVLAHPFLNMHEEELTEFIRTAKPCGLAAMETQYSTYSPEVTSTATRIAKEYNLLESGGSDYHGKAKTLIRLGVGKGNLKIPMGYYTELAKCVEM